MNLECCRRVKKTGLIFILAIVASIGLSFSLLRTFGANTVTMLW